MDPVAVGIGVRDAYLEPLLSLDDTSVLDVLEIMIDDGLAPCPRRAAWRRLGARWPLIAHGTELGIGCAGGVDAAYVTRVGEALEELHVRWYSEHLAFLGADGVDLGHFAPVAANEEALGVVARNVRRVRGACACPFLLENPADVLGWDTARGGSALGADYGAALVASDAGGLLDLTNLVLGARNDGYDALAFIESLPFERIVEIHLAGGRYDGALWIDSHDHDVDTEALALLDVVARRATNLRAVIIERDDRLPSLDRLLDEARRVRDVLADVGRAE